MTTSGKFCEHCGAPLRADSRFCEGCGQPVGASGGVATPTVAAPARAACPACGNADQVVAASSYSKATDPEVKGDDDRIQPGMVEMFLEQPEKPRPANVLGWAIAPFIPAVLFFVYWFAPIHRGFKFFLFGFTVVFWVAVFVPELNEEQIFAFVGLLHLLLYWVALFIGRDRHKVDLLTRKIPEYNAKMARWQHLQYCKRCQRVWLDNAAAAPVEVVETDKLLAG